MPPKRGNPKKWTPKTRTPFRSQRSTAYRKRPGTRRVMTPSGSRPSIGSAPFSHKFTRYTALSDLVSAFSGGNPILDQTFDSSATTSCLYGFSGTSMTADSTGIGNSYQGGGAFQFQLSDLPNYTDYTTLFDSYKIDQVDMEISQVQNAASAGNPASQMCTIYYATDYDDATVPTQALTLIERQRCKKWTFRGDGTPLRISLQPRLLQPIYQDGVTNAYGTASQNTWVDQLNISAAYYGMKFWIENMYMNSSSGQRGETHFKIRVKYHISCKDPV